MKDKNQEVEKIKFGNSSTEIDNLAKKVLTGEKVATSSLHDYHLIGKKKQSKIGDLFSILNSDSKELAIVCIEKIEIVKYGDISEEFAIKEGDGNLDNWRKIHQPYYSKLLLDIGKELDNKTLIVCEWFKIKHIL